MYRILLLRRGQVFETVEADIVDVTEIVDRTTELERRQGADDWEIVNGLGQRVVTKTRWRDVKGRVPDEQ